MKPTPDRGPAARRGSGDGERAIVSVRHAGRAKPVPRAARTQSVGVRRKGLRNVRGDLH